MGCGGGRAGGGPGGTLEGGGPGGGCLPGGSVEGCGGCGLAAVLRGMLSVFGFLGGEMSEVEVPSAFTLVKFMHRP